jgi:hypothetical protein
MPGWSSVASGARSMNRAAVSSASMTFSLRGSGVSEFSSCVRQNWQERGNWSSRSRNCRTSLRFTRVRILSRYIW